MLFPSNKKPSGFHRWRQSAWVCLTVKKAVRFSELHPWPSSPLHHLELNFILKAAQGRKMLTWGVFLCGWSPVEDLQWKLAQGRGKIRDCLFRAAGAGAVFSFYEKWFRMLWLKEDEKNWSFSLQEILLWRCGSAKVVFALAILKECRLEWHRIGHFVLMSWKEI